MPDETLQPQPLKPEKVKYQNPASVPGHHDYQNPGGAPKLSAKTIRSSLTTIMLSAPGSEIVISTRADEVAAKLWQMAMYPDPYSRVMARTTPKTQFRFLLELVYKSDGKDAPTRAEIDGNIEAAAAGGVKIVIIDSSLRPPREFVVDQ